VYVCVYECLFLFYLFILFVVDRKGFDIFCVNARHDVMFYMLLFQGCFFSF
jgi:hypothetical protein